MPPKARVLDDAELAQVEALAAVLTSEQIADYLGISRATFYEIMKRQEDVSRRYQKGRSRGIGSVAKGLLQQAQTGNTAAAIFYLKTQAGWKEAKDKDDAAESLAESLNKLADRLAD